MQIPELYELFLTHPSIETDTRKLKQGDLFFALKGPNFNGNEFAEQALKTGAAYAIVDEYSGSGNAKIILVDNVLNCLQELAKHHRLQFGRNIPFIAITGSNGKTTTKELLHEVLSSSYRTYTTAGNLNNHIGIPLTILKVKADAEMAIIEMGANHLKEIAGYCKYALPTHGIITNCGKAHLEGFGSEAAIQKGKGELYDHIRANEGTAFVMWDYDYLRTMSAGIPVIITYGTHNAAITGEVKNSSGFLEVSITAGTAIGDIKTQLVGEYNLPNVLAAVTVGKHFQVPESKIRSALENYAPSNSRSQLIKKGTNTIILDAYNANPTSMKAAIENFAKMEGIHKILLLGGMMELGESSLAEHESILSVINEHTWEAVALVGKDYPHVHHGWTNFENAEQAKAWFREQQFEGKQILIKGSRSMQMEKILE